MAGSKEDLRQKGGDTPVVKEDIFLSEQQKEENKAMAQNVIDAVDAIMKENGVGIDSDFYKGMHCQKYRFGDKVREFASLGFGGAGSIDMESGKAKKTAMRFDLGGVHLPDGLVERYRRPLPDTVRNDVSEGAQLDEVSARHNLILDIARRLGFFGPEAIKQIEEFRIRSGEFYDHPEKPFTLVTYSDYAGCISNFSIHHK
ncbi:MAG: hypothetical protein ABH816_01715 [Candidatus Levyibacteriota bacterium]